MNKFCLDCSRLLNVIIKKNDPFVFSCECGREYKSEPKDTLLYQKGFESMESNQKREILLENAEYDDAAFRTYKKCVKCNNEYQILIRIGDNETTYYKCEECGNVITN